MSSAFGTQWMPLLQLLRTQKHVPARAIARGLKTIDKRRMDRYNRAPNLPLLTGTPAAALERKAATTPLRTGALAIKKGMSAIYDSETGKRAPCTVLQLDRVQVISHKTRQKHGYWAVQVGCGWKHHTNVTKPELGHFSANGVSPKRHVAEFRVRDEKGLPQIGMAIKPGWFQEGQYVDARANCRGMGFAGGMKRHGFAGQPASHGTSLVHRAMGSAGGSQGSGSRVLPGKKMPGRMGGQQVTVQGLRVLKVDEPNGIVVVHGSVAGPKGCVVKIQDSNKHPWPKVHPAIPPNASPPMTAEATA